MKHKNIKINICHWLNRVLQKKRETIIDCINSSCVQNKCWHKFIWLKRSLTINLLVQGAQWFIFIDLMHVDWVENNKNGKCIWQLTLCYFCLVIVCWFKKKRKNGYKCHDILNVVRVIDLISQLKWKTRDYAHMEKLIKFKNKTRLKKKFINTCHHRAIALVILSGSIKIKLFSLFI